MILCRWLQPNINFILSEVQMYAHHFTFSSTTSTLISQQGHLDTHAKPELQDTGRNSSLEGDSKTNIKGNLNQFISEVFP